MSSTGSVTLWLAQLKGGDTEAARPIWERFVQQLLQLARRKMGDLPRRFADEEDIAISAFASFIQAVERGRFPRLDDRDDLWQLLIMITERKAIDLFHHEQRDKRGGGQVLDEAALVHSDNASAQRGLGEVQALIPTPAFAAEVAENFTRLLDRLRDDELRQIALRKMDGYTNEEIASQLDVALATVERRLRLIRKCWASEETS
jgi:RNA polymerase sigma factor (sigma-70 family)